MDFDSIFKQQEIDRLHRQISYMNTNIRNLIVDIEEGDVCGTDIVEALKGMIGE